ncbi:MAG: thioredoxin-dependent thiol peroxidase [Brevinema sp.]
MLKKGDLAPAFTLESNLGKPVSLSDFKGQWCVLYFYPKDNTPGCTKQAIDFSEMLEEFHAEGAEVIGINADTIESHQGFCRRFQLKMMLLSDNTKDTLKAYKVWGEKQFMGKIYEGLTRSTFIINPEGVITEAMYNVKALGHGKRALTALKKCQAEK